MAEIDIHSSAVRIELIGNVLLCVERPFLMFFKQDVCIATDIDLMQTDEFVVTERTLMQRLMHCNACGHDGQIERRAIIVGKMYDEKAYAHTYHCRCCGHLLMGDGYTYNFKEANRLDCKKQNV